VLYLRSWNSLTLQIDFNIHNFDVYDNCIGSVNDKYMIIHMHLNCELVDIIRKYNEAKNNSVNILAVLFREA
jgi:hypothetical protein